MKSTRQGFYAMLEALIGYVDERAKESAVNFAIYLAKNRWEPYDSLDCWIQADIRKTANIWQLYDDFLTDKTKTDDDPGN